MNFFKKIDNYLLHHYPSVWVTRVHIFFPIGVVLIGLLYGITRLIGWDKRERLYGEESMIFFMVIPVLIYLIYWFVFQSRYNVLKSKGRLSILQEYISYALYFLVFFTAYCFILIIPLAKEDAIKATVGYDNFIQEVDILNRGNSLVNKPQHVKSLLSGEIEVFNTTILDFSTNYKISQTNKIASNETPKVEVISEREALQRISDYLEVKRRYINNYYQPSPQEILDEALSTDDYYEYSFNEDWELSYKVERIYGIFTRGWFSGDEMKWFWRISLAFIAMLALIVWIFKQMNLRHFVFGLIALCLFPIVIGLFALVVYEILGLGYKAEEYFTFLIIMICYLVLVLYVGRGFMQKQLNQTAYVVTWFLHFWIPLLPFFAFFYVSAHRYYMTSERLRLVETLEAADIVYWSCVSVGLLSILVFKPIYAKFRSLPAAK